MSLDNVKEYLKKWGKDKEVMTFDVSSATVKEAAEALKTEEKRIAKSLTFADADGGCIMVVAAGDARIDNKKFKEYFKHKAKMLAPEEVFTLTGHKIGGVCPFALNPGVKVYLDESLNRFKTVFPACGTSNSAIELKIDELYEMSGAIDFIDVTKLPQE